MSYQDEYKSKLTTAEAVAATVQSGDLLKFGYFNGKPVMLTDALGKRHAELRDVTIISVATMPPIPMEVLQHKESFTWWDWHWSKATRLLKDHFESIIYAPVMYHSCEDFLSQGQVHKGQVPAWSWQQVGPMDDHGYFNFGPNNSESFEANMFSAKVCVEVNKHMPRCLGGSKEGIHISQVDAIVEAPDDQVIFAAPEFPAPAENEIKIAENLIPFMRNGSCIQLGIGGLPNALGQVIKKTDLKDLGIHSEMFVDPFVDMIDSGQINGLKKNIDVGKAVYTFGIGTQRMYDWMHNNPRISSNSVGYVNDPRVICRNDNFVSINQALQVDMFTNVSAESHGTRHITGCGGMMDFTLGAQWSKGGQSFICFPATYTDKEGNLQSNVVGYFEYGTNVTVNRHMVDYIVTEYGVRKMKAQNIWVRAENMIELAHPQFRDWLVDEANKLKIWTRTNKQHQ